MQKIIKLNKISNNKNQELGAIKESLLLFVCLILHVSNNKRQERNMPEFGAEDAMTI